MGIHTHVELQKLLRDLKKLISIFLAGADVLKDNKQKKGEQWTCSGGYVC